MDIFSLTCGILSFLLLFVFNIICVKKFGLLSCYSAYGEKWQPLNQNGINIWSLITNLTAILLVPPILVTGFGNPLQFICFFAPLYLLLVGATPNYREDLKIWKIHTYGAVLAIISMLIWMIFIVKSFAVVFPSLILALIIAYGTRTLKESWMYYLEMALYLSVYITLFFFV